MKSKISLFNKAILKQNFRRLWLWLLGVLFSYLFLFLLPLNQQFEMLGTRSTMKIEDYLESIFSTVTMMHGFFIHFGAVVALITAMFVFSYLFTPRNINMIHTFPLDRNSLFFTNYVTGLLFLLLPLVVGTLAATAYIASHHISAGNLYILELLCFFGAQFLFFNIAVLVIMIVGNAFAVPVLYTLFQYLYLGGKLLINALIYYMCFGITDYDLSVDRWTPIEYFSSYITLYRKPASHGMVCMLSEKKILVCYLVFAVLIGIIAYIVYVKKQIETAGDLITISWLKPIFQWCAALASSVFGLALFVSMYLYDESHVGFGLIFICMTVIGVVAFFLAQMLLDKSLHVFRKKVCISCIAYTACVSVFLILLQMDVFGVASYMPDRSEVAQVLFNSPIAAYSDSGWQLADEQEEIDEVLSMHKLILENKASFEKGDAMFYIMYVLKSGKRVSRSYWMNLYSDGEDVEVDDTGERKDVPVQLLQQQALNYRLQTDHILESMFGVHYEQVRPISMSYGKFDEQLDGYVETDLTYSQTNKLYQALLADIEDGSYARALSKAVTEYEGEEFWDISLNLQYSPGKENPQIERMTWKNYDFDWEDEYGWTTQIYITKECTHLVKALKKIDPKLLEDMKTGSY